MSNLPTPPVVSAPARLGAPAADAALSAATTSVATGVPVEQVGAPAPPVLGGASVTAVVPGAGAPQAPVVPMTPKAPAVPGTAVPRSPDAPFLARTGVDTGSLLVLAVLLVLLGVSLLRASTRPSA